MIGRKDAETVWPSGRTVFFMVFFGRKWPEEWCGARTGRGYFWSFPDGKEGEAFGPSAWSVFFFCPKVSLFAFRRYSRVLHTGSGERTFSAVPGFHAGLFRAVLPGKSGGKTLFLRMRCKGGGCGPGTGCVEEGSRRRAGAATEAFSAQSVRYEAYFSKAGCLAESTEKVRPHGKLCFHEAFASFLVSPTGFEPVLEA